jgi:hypothetical protein
MTLLCQFFWPPVKITTEHRSHDTTVQTASVLHRVKPRNLQKTNVVRCRLLARESGTIYAMRMNKLAPWRTEDWHVPSRLRLASASLAFAMPHGSKRTTSLFRETCFSNFFQNFSLRSPSTKERSPKLNTPTVHQRTLRTVPIGSCWGLVPVTVIREGLPEFFEEKWFARPTTTHQSTSAQRLTRKTFGNTFHVSQNVSKIELLATPSVLSRPCAVIRSSLYKDAPRHRLLTKTH